MRLVRDAGAADFPALAEIFHAAVRIGAKTAYSDAQRAAWCPDVPEGARWAKRLAGLDILVAETGGKIVGFMAMDRESGLVDLSYVHPDHMRQGHADALYAVLEGRARAGGRRRLTTEASLLAEPFFARHGWALVARQQVERAGVLIPNARMEKSLSSAAVDLAAS
ncbi:MAG: GNAT family N-acetyltransferase [Silicimonas sp.]|nr:GNAT family N-acetyltransferase [Silicimonas sp.]